MQAIGHVTPHAWAVDAWSAIVNDGAGLGGIAFELAVIAGAALGVAALAVAQLRRSLLR